MKFRVRNFQSWEDSGWVELAPKGQLTVFLGDSHSGKSALVRRPWKRVAYNDPLGDDLLRFGATVMVYDVEMDDNSLLTWRYSAGGINEYLLTPAGGQTQKFTGFGRKVPAQVQEAMDVLTLRVGDVAVRPGLIEQRDKMFDSLSGPSRARLLHILAGVDAVTAATDDCKTDLYRAGQDGKRLAEVLAENAKQQKELAWVEPFGGMLQELTVLQKDITSIYEKRTRLAAALTRREVAEAMLLASQATINRLKELPHVAEALAMAERAEETRIKLAGLIIRRRQAADALNDADIIISRRAGLPLVNGALLIVEQACVRRNKLADIMARRQRADNDKMAAEEIFTRLAHIPRVSALLAEAGDFGQRADKLRQALLRREAARIQIDNTARILANAPALQKTRILLAEIEAVMAKREQLAAVLTRRATAWMVMDEQSSRLIVLENELADVHGIYEDALKDQTVICPKCGCKFSPNKKEEAA